MGLSPRYALLAQQPCSRRRLHVPSSSATSTRVFTGRRVTARPDADGDARQLSPVRARTYREANSGAGSDEDAAPLLPVASEGSGSPVHFPMRKMPSTSASPQPTTPPDSFAILASPYSAPDRRDGSGLPTQAFTEACGRQDGGVA